MRSDDKDNSVLEPPGYMQEKVTKDNKKKTLIVTKNVPDRSSGSDDGKSDDGTNDANAHETHDAVEISPPTGLEVLAL